MNIFKITNITNTLGKRDPKFNTNLTIKYVDGLNNKTINIKPNDVVYLKISSLPLQIHNLRMNGLIIVDETSNEELNEIINKRVVKPNNNILEIKYETENIVDNSDSENKNKKNNLTHKKKNIETEIE